MLATIHSPSLAEFLTAGPYVGYAYSYPHKTAYRALAPARQLREVWSSEPRDSVFLYLHVPFCEMRCGFCNLFTYSQPAEEWVARYLASLRQQMQVVAAEVPGVKFSRLAIGGGTPTFLKTAELALLFEQLESVLNVPLANIPISVEASPATLDDEKLALFRQVGVNRLSLGIQSFLPEDLGAMGRPQQMAQVWRAIERIRQAGIPVLNLDLIYGAAGQTPARWLDSLREAVACRPEELYIYPLYVRPLTGLGGKTAPADDTRLALYRQAREFLLASDYEQVSMRMFRRRGQSEAAAPVYCCQSDGMIGLGAGARSYTRELHYASPFAVRQKSILAIIDNFVSQSPAEMALVKHGFELDGEEQRRRYVILMLLQAAGLDADEYRRQFRGGSCRLPETGSFRHESGSELWTDFPELDELVELGLADVEGSRLVLTAVGLEQSDAIGPWLYSADVKRRMQEFSWTTA